MSILRACVIPVVGLLLAACTSAGPSPAGERGIVVTGTGRVALRPDTGVKLGGLVSATESSPVRPMARMTMATMAGPVEPGQLEVTVSLEARYAIEP